MVCFFAPRWPGQLFPFCIAAFGDQFARHTGGDELEELKRDFFWESATVDRDQLETVTDSDLCFFLVFL